jgi:hypothetical protein
MLLDLVGVLRPGILPLSLVLGWVHWIPLKSSCMAGLCWQSNSVYGINLWSGLFFIPPCWALLELNRWVRPTYASWEYASGRGDKYKIRFKRNTGSSKQEVPTTLGVQRRNNNSWADGGRGRQLGQIRKNISWRLCHLRQTLKVKKCARCRGSYL